MAGEYERVLTVKPDVLVYRIPPRPSNRGYRAADWGLDKPSWTGRMRIIAQGDKVTIKLEDKVNGELFALAPIDAYPGVAVESVTDSSRYFVLKIADGSGRTAFIGLGFADRGDAFDFNVTLQDHFNSVKKDKEIEENINTQPALNLQLKEGQTFKISLGGKMGSKPQGTARPRTNAPVGGAGIFLPPPPGGAAASKPQTTYQHPAADTATNDFLGLTVSNPQPTNQFGQSDWGEFASAQSTTTTSNNAASSDPGWVQF